MVILQKLSNILRWKMYKYFKYNVLQIYSQSEFKFADGRRRAQMKGERVHFERRMSGYVKDMYRLTMW